MIFVPDRRPDPQPECDPVPAASRRPSKRQGRSAVQVLALVAAVLLLGGCAKPWVTAGAVDLPAERQATIVLPDSLVPGSLRLDGRAAPHRDVSEITLSPGRHTLAWRYLHRNRHEEARTLAVDLLAGDRMVMRQRFFAADGPLGPVGDVAGFTVETFFMPLRWLLPPGEEPPPGRLHAWVEDQTTGDLIAGLPPDLPTGYVELTIVPID